MARKATVAAFRVWAEADANIQAVLDLVSGGMTLRNAAMQIKQPYTCLQSWFRETPERMERLEATRKAYADSVMEEAKEIADTVKPDKDEVAKARLQFDVRREHAKAFNRPVWGDKVEVDKAVTLRADAALVGTVADLLLKAKRPSIVIDAPGRVVEPDSPAVSLPAPAAKVPA